MRKEYKILRQVEDNLLIVKDKSYKRDDYFSIDWSNKCIGILGERGIGKTTILIQKRKETNNSFYFSADNIIIKSVGLFEFVMFCFQNFDIKSFFIDEIFRYDNWKQELKNIIDSFPQLNIIFSGSSSLALYDGIIDLGRRIYDYKMHTLSFREYLNLKYNYDFKSITLDDIVNNHKNLATIYSTKLKEIYFEEYLKMGAYPFGLEVNYNSYVNLLQKTLDRIIMEDLIYIRSFQTTSLDKLSKMIYFIANTTPSELSINHLSNKIGVDKNLVDNVLYYLSKIGVVNLIQKGKKTSEKVRKEYKIFLSDTSKYYINNYDPDIGTIREAFFVSEIKKNENIDIFLPQKGDYYLEYNNMKFIFELGGKNKSKRKYLDNTYIVKDGINISEDDHVIPLWLFGFLS